MAASVTIPGTGGGTVGVTTNAQSATFNASLAKTISDVLNALPPGNVTSENGSFPAHVNNLVVPLNGQNLTVAGGNAGATYDYLTIGDGLNETITATGTGPFQVLAGTGGLDYTGLDGPQTVLAGGGTVGSAANIIRLGSGTNNYVAVGGGNDTVTNMGSGTIWAGGSTNVVTTSTVAGTSNFVVLAGGTATVNSGAGHDTVYSGGVGDVVVRVGSGTMDFIGGANNATVFGSGSNTTTLIGGAGGSITYANTASGGAEYHAQGGAEVFNASLSIGSNTVYGAYGQSGTETLIGGSGNDYLDPLNAAASLVGGSGNDTLVGARFNSTVAGSGNATLTGGVGSDTFLFKNGYAGGHDYVTDLSAGDVVNLAYYGYNAAGISNLIASAAVAGGSSTITLSDSTQITFIGITSLNSGSFTSS
jgi:Ca2+-binding RTX toxin-like protein